MHVAAKRKRQERVSLARQLLYTSSRSVVCPECRKPALNIRDLEYDGGNAHGLVRYLTCSNCRCFNSVSLRRAGVTAQNYGERLPSETQSASACRSWSIRARSAT